jgi:hypothetical protein
VQVENDKILKKYWGLRTLSAGDWTPGGIKFLGTRSARRLPPAELLDSASNQGLDFNCC